MDYSKRTPVNSIKTDRYMKKSPGDGKRKRGAGAGGKGIGSPDIGLNIEEEEVLNLKSIAKIQVYRENLLAFFTTTDYANFTLACHDLFELSILDLCTDTPEQWMNKQWFEWMKVFFQAQPQEYVETDNYFIMFGMWRRTNNRDLNKIRPYLSCTNRHWLLDEWIQEIPVVPWKKDPQNRKKRPKRELKFTTVYFF